ncbi:unnamed protein product, partial [Choristocarpus tenellus]
GCQTIVFFHIPKTGGESVRYWASPSYRRNRKRYGWENFRFISIRTNPFAHVKQKQLLKSIKPWNTEWIRTKGTHNFVELHCGHALSLMQADETLAEMRDAHERNGCGFFVFTIIREPVDWTLSLYNDICHRRLHGHQDTCPQDVS